MKRWIWTCFQMSVALGLPLCCGCGSGYYDNVMDQRVKLEKQTGAFSALFPGATEIAGTTMSIRLPQKFTTFFNETSHHPHDKSDTIDPARLNPPFLPIPGLIGCYEAKQKDANGREFPYYCYLAAKKLAPQEKPILRQQFLDALKGTFPNVATEQVAAPTPEGASVQWEKISASGKQMFPIDNASTREDLDGMFQLWLYTIDDGYIIVAWRIPDAIESQVHLADLAVLSAGTLKGKQENPAPPQ